MSGHEPILDVRRELDGDHAIGHDLYLELLHPALGLAKGREHGLTFIFPEINSVPIQPRPHEEITEPPVATSENLYARYNTPT